MSTQSKSPISNRARAEHLNDLGISVVSRVLGIEEPKNKFAMTDAEGHSVKVKVQNHMNHLKLGQCFTVDVGPDTQKVLGHDRLIFVDYDDPRKIRVYECLDKGTYHMDYAGGGASYAPRGMKRIIMCFETSRMRLLSEVEDADILREMKSFSDAKKFNLESSSYRPAA